MIEENLTEEEKLAKNVEEDYLRRREERKATERGWELNINFVNGNQYCGIDGKGELFQEESGHDSIAVKRHHESIYLGLAYSFRGSVH